MNILVTGGAGYIGSHTCLALLEAGFRPVIVDNFSNSGPVAVERVRELAGALTFRAPPRMCVTDERLIGFSASIPSKPSSILRG